MKSKNKLIIIFFALGFFFIAGNLISSNSNSNNVNENNTKEKIQEKDILIPEKSWFNNNENPISIDENTGQNWAWARTQEWCRKGDGSYGNPYVIENVSINCYGSGSGITIINSKNDYFRIQNCSVYNSESGSNAGIKLENTNNGTIFNNARFKILLINDCDNNNITGNTAGNDSTLVQDRLIYLDNSCDGNLIAGNNVSDNIGYGICLSSNCNGNTVTNNTGNNGWMGIYLSSNCNGNTVTNNTANDNHQIGIRIVNYCHKNNITGNTANDISGVGYDQQKGISLYFECDRNTISGNTANNNVEYGIRIVDDCYNNTISGNTANNNVKYGIYLVEDCYNNTISGNTANENGYYGIYLDRCDNNTITGNKNTFNYNGIAGIMLEDCDGNNITDNIANYNGIYGICLNSSSWNNISFNEFIGNQICAFNDLYCVGNEFTNNYCNNRPELSSGSVEPKRGNQNTQFTFFVVYTDLDDDIPIYVNITINGTSYEMDKQYILDDVYTDGCIYNFTITLAPAAHNFTYYFECRDVYTTVTTSNYDNLEVYRTVVTDGGGGGGGGSKQEEIPLGNFPLLFTVMGIVSLVLYYKKKKKIKF